MKYKVTPLSITSILLILLSIYLFFNPGSEGWGMLIAFFLIPISIAVFGVDILIQTIPIKYYQKCIIEVVLLLFIYIIWLK